MSISLNVEIIGNKEITDLYNTETLTIAGKTEIELHELVVGDSWQNIPVSKIGTISKIIGNVTSTSTFVDPTANIKITYTPSGSITIPINGILVYSVDETFAGTVSTLEVSTNSTTAMNINLSILGI